MTTADYGSTDLKDLEAIKPNKKEKRPPTSSLIVVLLQGVMQVGGFTAIIPTATMYVKAVGGSASTAGWLVGITALGTGLMQPFLGYPLKHYRLKTLMLALCGFNFVGWILYALGDLSGSLARRLRHLAGRDRRGRDPIHPAALEPPHRSQGEQFLGVDACSRLSVSKSNARYQKPSVSTH